MKSTRGPGALPRRALLAGAASAVAGTGLAQTGQPVRLMVTAAAGGSTDVIARIVAPGMSEALGGRPVLVENRGGGGGVIGAEAVATAAPDGTTLGFFTVSAAVLNALLHRNLRFDTERAFAPVSLVATFPMVVTVGNHVPARDLPDFVAWMRSRPGRTTYGSAGPGTINHLGALLLCNRTGTAAEHIPFRGAGPVFASMMSGDTDFLVEGIPSQAPFVRQGSIRALAVTGRQRSPLLPEVPTVIEGGVPDFEIVNWMAVFAPSGTPALVIGALSTAVRAAVRAPGGERRLREAGVEPAGTSAEELQAFWDGQFRLWRPVVASSGATVE
ncbi:Bug family tripartite tricarboxylate transporter substrate binding protein [Pararoseomonas indoligenes]|uniref:Tripartite tricarboxylate transporter substrate binding protein n=1 Tax=Roseomonas indoligenes TaxID=2820811 RepID=A0A940MWI1_9PROT|nr:tripartite tricarboxylate transporter substrate-binding protein [Pararoseomonas indoligenes]MBP0495513.1 tripartite tricarboxylate transporter substrate binding protein [Pararoseomonas indoligenes]